MKKEKNNEDACREVGKQFLKKSVFVGLDFFGKTLTKVPVGDQVFEEVGGENEGNGKVWVVNLGGDESTRGGMSDREHRLWSSILDRMSEVLVNFGKFSVYTLSLSVVLAYFWYSFVVYKKGLEYRYAPESLLDLAVLSGLFGWLGSRLAFVATHLPTFQVNWLRVFLLSAYPGYDYLGLLVGLVVGVSLLSRRGEVKLSDGVDLVGLGLPAAIAFERLGRVFSGQTTLVFGLPIEIFQVFLFLLIFVWLWKLEGEYRTFEWYRFRKTQAKSGFIFGMFLFLSGIVIGFNSILLGVVSVLVGVVVIYRQSGRSLDYDVKLLPFVKRWYTKSK